MCGPYHFYSKEDYHSQYNAFSNTMYTTEGNLHFTNTVMLDILKADTQDFNILGHLMFWNMTLR